jgi:hypothetical protein
LQLQIPYIVVYKGDLQLQIPYIVVYKGDLQLQIPYIVVYTGHFLVANGLDHRRQMAGMKFADFFSNKESK